MAQNGSRIRKDVRHTVGLLVVLLLAAPALAAPWVDEDLGLRLDPPKGWTVRTGEAGARVRLYAPGPGKPRANIGLKVEEMEEEPDLDAVAAALASTLEGFRLLSRGAASVGGLPGRRLTYVATVSGRPFQATQTLVLRGGRLFAFTLVTVPEAHESYLGTYTHLLQGARWLP